MGWSSILEANEARFFSNPFFQESFKNISELSLFYGIAFLLLSQFLQEKDDVS